jgi:lipid II isoglutaminyl synthase (glutamine-hydrolysing)
MDYPTLRIAHLYPSLLNVAGDGGNVMALVQRCAWRGIPTEVVEIEQGDTPDFTTFDLILFHGGQDVEMDVVARDLGLKIPSLREAADQGVLIFAVCAGLQLLGHRYIPSIGEPMEGAAILDLETRGGSQRFMQHAAVEVTLNGETGTVVGFENHSGQTTLGPGARPFGTIVAGAGNNGQDGTEGAVRDNVFATYLHGPVLPKNPWLTDQLIRIALGRRTGQPVELAPLDDNAEDRAHEVALAKAMRNKGQYTALTPAELVRNR